MKEKLKNKKVAYTIIGIVSVLLVMLAVTYAYWLVTKIQTGENEITAGCLDITISGEKNDIELTNQFPMSDEDGMKLVPYEFTVTNNCNTSVDYQVALEATGDSSNALSGTSLKVALNDSAKLYSAYPEVETTIDGAYESRALGYSRLSASGNQGSSATYELRIWIDKDAPISEMNKTFKSKISVTVGQGIDSPYEEGTLAYDILANYNGVNAIREVDTAGKHEIIVTGDQYISTSDNYYYGTKYIYDKITGEYTLSGTIVQATLDECRNGTKTCGKYTLKNTSSTYSSTTLYEVTDWNSSRGTDWVISNTIEYVNAFGKITNSSESGLYKTQDDLGDSYYFRGNVTNNYVQFGSYAANSEVNGTTYAEETPMYWRIVRINGDGTIRLVYDGTKKVENGILHTSVIGDSEYNSEVYDKKHIGYTYDDGNGNQVDSLIKGALDTWYDTHLEVTYGDKIADSIFCNDRSEASYAYSDENHSPITDPNQAEYIDIYYGAYKRLRTYKVPSLKCPNKSDRYTASDTTNGNGLLSNPVGLITADEEVFAGNAAFKKNTDYYLYNGFSYWTSSSSDWEDNAACVVVWYVNNGFLGGEYIDNELGVRPVINLKADVKFTGDGTIDSPYKIVTE